MYISPKRSEKYNIFLNAPEEDRLSAILPLVFFTIGIIFSVLSYIIFSSGFAAFFICCGITIIGLTSPFVLRLFAYKIDDNYIDEISKLVCAYWDMSQLDQQNYRNLMGDIFSNLYTDNFVSNHKDIRDATKLFEMKKLKDLPKDVQEIIQSEMRIVRETKRIMDGFNE